MSCKHSRGRASLGLAPIKKPRFRGIVKYFSEPLRRQAELRFGEDVRALGKQKRPAADSAPGAVWAIIAWLTQSDVIR